ncbi:MAG: hypothetical protein M0C28_29795 [Candidatus Moduliflexus flocculans]|nr:hypothetical protein [Candidatus Moduliflexus flocculans]
MRAEADEAESIQKSLTESQSVIEIESAKLQEELRAVSAQLGGMELAEAQGQASYWITRVAVAEQRTGRCDDKKRGKGQGGREVRCAAFRVDGALERSRHVIERPGHRKNIPA